LGLIRRPASLLNGKEPMPLLDGKEPMYFERFPETLRVKKNTGIHFQDLLYVEDSFLADINVPLMIESNRYLLSAHEENALLTDLFCKLSKQKSQ
jgi:hypothetical protein